MHSDAQMRLVATDVKCTSFPRLLESPGFLFVTFSGPGKSQKMGIVLESLEILMQGPGQSWNFLGYDVGGGHNDAGADAKICEN